MPELPSGSGESSSASDMEPAPLRIPPRKPLPATSRAAGAVTQNQTGLSDSTATAHTSRVVSGHVSASDIGGAFGEPAASSHTLVPSVSMFETRDITKEGDTIMTQQPDTSARAQESKIPRWIGSKEPAKVEESNKHSIPPRFHLQNPYTPAKLRFTTDTPSSPQQKSKIPVPSNQSIPSTPNNQSQPTSAKSHEGQCHSFDDPFVSETKARKPASFSSPSPGNALNIRDRRKTFEQGNAGLTMPIPALPDLRQPKPALVEGDSTPSHIVTRQHSDKSFWTAKSKLSEEKLYQQQGSIQASTKKSMPTPMKLESSPSVSELRKSFEKSPEHPEQPKDDGNSVSNRKSSSLTFEHHPGPGLMSGSIHHSKLPIRSGSTLRRSVNPLIDPDQVRRVELKGEGRKSVGLPAGLKSNRESFASFSSKTKAQLQSHAQGQNSSPSASVKREMSYSVFPPESSQLSRNMLPSLDGTDSDRVRVKKGNKVTTSAFQEDIRPSIETDSHLDRKVLGCKKFGELLNMFEQRGNCIVMQKSRPGKNSVDSGANGAISQSMPPAESVQSTFDFTRISGIAPSISMFIDTDDFTVDFSQIGTDGEHAASLFNGEQITKKESPVKQHIKHFERLGRRASMVTKRLSIKRQEPEDRGTERTPKWKKCKATWRKISDSVKTSVKVWKARGSEETSTDDSDAVGGTDDPSSKISGPSTANSGPSPFGFSLYRTKHKTESSSEPVASPEGSRKESFGSRIVGGLSQLNTFAFGLDGHQHSRPVVDEGSTTSNPATPPSASPTIVDPNALQKAMSKQSAAERHRRRQEARREKADRVRSMFKGKQKESTEKSGGKEDKGKGKDKEVCDAQTQVSPNVEGKTDSGFVVYDTEHVNLRHPRPRRPGPVRKIANLYKDKSLSGGISATASKGGSVVSLKGKEKEDAAERMCTTPGGLGWSLWMRKSEELSRRERKEE
ncbi:hypothetical protein F5Y18DRAFT_438775 [Xylariaceae sp. FL1019]|nr:hypothetical protein F5Y18DRAFT_438775 [Xylariaceae sp. FL1019]